MTGAPADPEARFRRLPAALRRWTPGLLWRRAWAPLKRRRRHLLLKRLAERYRRTGPVGEGAVIAVGAFSRATGLGRAAAYEVERLRREHAGLHTIDLDDDAPPPTGPVSALYLLCQPDALNLALRRFAPEDIACARRTALWVWETPRFAPEFSPAFALVDHVWTPSRYSAAAIRAAAPALVGVSVRPHAVSPPSAKGAMGLSRFGVAADAWLGLAIMDLSHCPARKNPWAHVAAWRAAFRDDPQRVLLIKARFSRRTAVVRRELQHLIGESPAVRIIEEDLADDDVAALLRRANMYLSLHRAEGFGLPMMEALAAGTPVVATGWSGAVDLAMAHADFHPVPFSMTPCRDWLGAYPGPAFEWAEADVSAAAALCRQLASRDHSRSRPATGHRGG